MIDHNQIGICPDCGATYTLHDGCELCDEWGDDAREINEQWSEAEWDAKQQIKEDRDESDYLSRFEW